MKNSPLGLVCSYRKTEPIIVEELNVPQPAKRTVIREFAGKSFFVMVMSYVEYRWICGRPETIFGQLLDRV
ncbi:hypothetical protein BAU14_09880 [Enterococcus sp. CU9D]|nr:hypothetical protein BAU14_09880 [Enterococcus sp. CU9D]